MKKQKDIYLTCPYCGKVFGKTNTTEKTSVYCPGCGRLLEINYRKGIYTVREAELDYIAEICEK